MSTLKVNDIVEATSGGGKIWPCRAWVNFNGNSTITIRDDGNVSSITDNATGKYTLNFTNTLSNANYAACRTLDYNSTHDGGVLTSSEVLSATSSAFQLTSTTHTGVTYDAVRIDVMITV